MPGSARLLGVFGLALVACGGRYQTEGYGDEAGIGGTAGTTGATGGASAGAAAGGGGGGAPRPNEGGAGAVLSGGSAGAVSSEGGGGGVSSGGVATCSSLPQECASSNDVVYVGGVELRYPGPGSCGECSSTCAECGVSCKLPIQIVPRCSGNRVHLHACSTPDARGACLNTLVEEPYYVDPMGKRWSVVSLVASEPMQFAVVGTRMASLTLNITDGAALGVLQVAVLACNTEPYYVLPC